MICGYPSLHPGTKTWTPVSAPRSLYLASEHIQSFTLPVFAGWSREPFLSLIHSAVKTSAQSLHGNLTHMRTHAQTRTHTAFSLLLHPWQQIPETQAALLPKSLEEVRVAARVSARTTRDKLIRMAHNQGTPAPNWCTSPSDNEWHLRPSASSKRVFAESVCARERLKPIWGGILLINKPLKWPSFFLCHSPEGLVWNAFKAWRHNKLEAMQRCTNSLLSVAALISALELCKDEMSQ